MRKPTVFLWLLTFVLVGVGCKNPEKAQERGKEAAWKSYVAAMNAKGPIVETKTGEAMQIPGHPGYVYRGVFINHNSHARVEIAPPDESGYYEGDDAHYKFYRGNCGSFSIPHPRPGNDPNAYYGDAYGNDCFLNNVFRVTSVSKGAIWYVVDLDTLKSADELMTPNHFVHYQTGTVLGIGGTLPALLKSEISFSASFGKGMSASARGNTVQIGDATFVLRVKSAEGIYTIEATGTSGADRQQSIVGLAAAITNGTTVRFPVDYHVYRQMDLVGVFSQSKIGRLDAESIEVVK